MHKQQNPGRTDWTVKELAEQAGLNPSRIRQLLLAGEIKGHKRGPIWLVPNAEAQRWLENRRGYAVFLFGLLLTQSLACYR